MVALVIMGVCLVCVSIFWVIPSEKSCVKNEEKNTRWWGNFLATDWPSFLWDSRHFAIEAMSCIFFQIPFSTHITHLIVPHFGLGIALGEFINSFQYFRYSCIFATCSKNKGIVRATEIICQGCVGPGTQVASQARVLNSGQNRQTLSSEIQTRAGKIFYPIAQTPKLSNFRPFAQM